MRLTLSRARLSRSLEGSASFNPECDQTCYYIRLVVAGFCAFEEIELRKRKKGRKEGKKEYRVKISIIGSALLL